MKVCVLGLSHLGTVTAASLASSGYSVTGLDFESTTIERLRNGIPPVFEPGLETLISDGIRANKLSFTSDIAKAVNKIDVLWVAYDTPVDADDRADVQFVLERVALVLPHLRSHVLVLISSQLLVGSTRRLEGLLQIASNESEITFAYSPENLRLGHAIEDFTQADRVIIGVRSKRDRSVLEALFSKYTNRIEWMSVESAEMTKHALNAFLAMSVSFVNEIANICEQVGADAKEVERGLKSESRIGPKAYLTPGASFGGGTLARDIAFLLDVADQHSVSTHLLHAVRVSNDVHRRWIRKKIISVLGDLRERTIAVWGLTYKPGTDTLRRSESIQLCEWLFDNGARVQAHDPAVTTLPGAFVKKIVLCQSPFDALVGASALVIATEWPDYADLNSAEIASAMTNLCVFDPGGFLAKQLESIPEIRFITVGKS